MPSKEIGYVFRTAPRRHQAEDLVRGWLKPAWGRLHEMRTGKGVLTVYEMDALAQQGLASRFLVVCPKRVISTWTEAIETHAAMPFVVCLHTPPEDSELRPVIVLTNYERIWEKHDRRILARRGLIDWCPEYVVMDEAQKVKNRMAWRSKAAYLLGRVAKYRRVLAGTPAPNGLADYYGVFRFLDPAIFGTWAEFAGRYLVLDWYRKPVGYRNTEELVAKIHSIGSRVRRVDCLDVPESEDVMVKVDLPDSARRIYKQMAETLRAELTEGKQASAAIVLTKILRLAQIAGGFVTREDGVSEHLHDAKLNALFEVLDEALMDGGKVVVFVQFLPELRKIAEHLGRDRIGFETLYGETKSDSCVQARFRTDQDCRVLVCQIASGSLGLDLSAADTAIFYSWSFDAATYEQARARIWKPNGKLTHVHLIARNTVDQMMLAVVQRKIALSELVLDRWEEVVGG